MPNTIVYPTKVDGRATPEFMCWLDMKRRCFNPKIKNYHRYGGRGITVCDEWKNSFQVFMRDMGPRPQSDGARSAYSIDRKDNDGNYEPGNCRWATKKEQVNNTGRNHKVTFDGETRTLAEWAEILKVDASTVSARLVRGWSESNAVSLPVQRPYACINRQS